MKYLVILTTLFLVACNTDENGNIIIDSDSPIAEIVNELECVEAIGTNYDYNGWQTTGTKEADVTVTDLIDNGDGTYTVETTTDYVTGSTRLIDWQFSSADCTGTVTRYDDGIQASTYDYHIIDNNFWWCDSGDVPNDGVANSCQVFVLQ